MPAVTAASPDWRPRAGPARPLLSIVLADWGVRESLHILKYLEQQTNRSFEIVWVEFYGRKLLDWALPLHMPPWCTYHKHLIYNAGIIAARGDVIAICDSDAMVGPNFVEAIVDHFERELESVFHLDQFRNSRRDLYPFRYPTFAEVIGMGCINNAGGITRGMSNEADILHQRNYGACMAARRSDLLRIGGADMHHDYLGHICGPYEMTFRLINAGLREHWSKNEFLYHTWHPGQAGAGNRMGPHDGKHMSTRALNLRKSLQVQPHEKNPGIEFLQDHPEQSAEAMAHLIAPSYQHRWKMAA